MQLSLNYLGVGGEDLFIWTQSINQKMKTILITGIGMDSIFSGVLKGKKIKIRWFCFMDSEQAVNIGDTIVNTSQKKDILFTQ